MHPTPPPSQTITNLKGEVTFRRLLARQHVTGEILLPDYFGKEEHDKILAGRVASTRQAMHHLASDRNVTLSPFVELGAERCQRSLLLVNEFHAQGIAADISLDQLQTASHFAKHFGWEKLPLRVCCDVNNLPILSNSVPFVFCYEFLHHFPAIAPVMQQIYCILHEGHFYFNEEPFKRPRLRLYRQKSKIYAANVLRRSKVLRTLEKFISEPWSDEIEHGIVENDRISVKEWSHALSLFDRHETQLLSVGGRIKSRLLPEIRIANWLNMLLGGGITSLALKKSSNPSLSSNDLIDLLLCPNCLAQGKADSRTPVAWRKTEQALNCPLCDSSYPIMEGAIVLLEKNLSHSLYPELSE